MKVKGVKISKEVAKLAKNIQQLNRSWIKAGCWEMVTTHVRKGRIVEVRKEVTLNKRKKTKLAKPSRHHGILPDSATTRIRVCGKPGTPERIEALRKAYEDGHDPFTITDEQIDGPLAIIIEGIEYEPKGDDGKGTLRRACSDQMRGESFDDRSMYNDV